jgi:hypothetical protein
MSFTATSRASFAITVRFWPTLALVALIALIFTTPCFAKDPTFPSPGDVVVMGGVNGGGSAQNSAEFYSFKKKKFFPTGSMNSNRGGLQAQWITPAAERQVNFGVAVGGFTGTASLSGGTITFDIDNLATVEAYDPLTGTWNTLSKSMAQGRSLASSIVWPADVPSPGGYLAGHVLVWGGLCNSTSLSNCKNSSLVHPDMDVTAAATSPTFPSMLDQLTLLGDDTLIETGGFTDFSGTTNNHGTTFDLLEHKPPVANNMSSGRAGHTATLLKDGTVLIVGGVNKSGGVLHALNTAEIYDPSTKTFTPLDVTMSQPRAFHVAALQKNGKVIIAGGFDGTGTLSLSGDSSHVTGTLDMASGEILRNAEIYNPKKHTFKCVRGVDKSTGLCKDVMNASRIFATATPLKSTGVLIAGGIGSNGNSSSVGVLSSAERFAGQFHKVGDMETPRAMHGAMRMLK